MLTEHVAAGRWASRLVMIVSLVPSLASATSLVVIWTRTQIVAAADSLEVGVSSDGRIVARSEVCKLHLTNGYLTSVTGSYRYPDTGFSVWEALDGAANAANSVDAALKIADERIVPRQRESIEVYKRRRPAAFRRRFHELNTRLVVARVASDGRAEVRHVDLLAQEDGTVKAVPDLAALRALHATEVGTLFLGQTAEIEKTDLAALSRSKSVVEIARYLVRIEERADPDHVGGPISILVMDKAGPRWIERGACQ